MDRKIAYATQVPLVEDWLKSQRNAMVALAALTQCINGTPVLADGLSVVPTVPASLAVQVLPGSIYAPVAVDATEYGNIGADTIHTIMKQGMNLDALVLTLTPPGTIGEAINYLIQAQLTETDTDNVVLPYVNVADPEHPFTGPNDSGLMQPTTRKASITVQAKAGTSAAAGTQTTPTPDAGWVGLYQVTVAQGATTLDSTKIFQVDDAPFLYKKLPEIPKWVQSGEFLWADNDTGSENAIVATCTPKVTAYTKGQHFFVKKKNVANTGNLTANFGGGVVAVLDLTGAQIGSGNAGGNYVMHLVYDGASMRWVNGSITNTSISSITATSGEGVTVGGSAPYPVSLNFPGLSSASPTALDLFAFYDNEGAHHMKITWAALLALIQSGTQQVSLATIAPVMMVSQVRGGNNSPQAASGGLWTKRGLNTQIAQQIPGASFNTSNGQMTLPAGIYRASIAGVAYGTGNHKARLQDVTNGVTLGEGVTCDCHPAGTGTGLGNSGNVANASTGEFRFTLAGPAVVELQHYLRDSGGMGDTSNIGSETHTDGYVTITREG